MQGGADAREPLPPGEVERLQRVAAEQVAGDEAWRDGLEDAQAGPLLDWALRHTDLAVARLGGAGTLTEDDAFAAADQARALLTALAADRKGEPRDTVLARCEPHLGPPLFESRAAGAAALAEVLSPVPEPAPPPIPTSPAAPPPARPGGGGSRVIPFALAGVVILSLIGALVVFCRPAGPQATPAPSGPLSPPLPGPAAPGANTAAGDWYEIFFTQPRYPDRPEDHRGGIDERLVGFMGTAQRSLDVAIYDFDLQNVAEAMAQARGRGVTVRMVTDTDTLENKDQAIQRAIGTVRRAQIPIVDDKRRPIMHHKFVVVDGQAVLTGSWNFTTGDTYRLNNNAVILRSPQVATNFTDEFDKMFVLRKFGPNKPKGLPYPRVTIGDATVETRFASEDDPSVRLIEWITAARTRVDFMAFSFTHDGIGRATIQRGGAGVRVRGVFETTGSETRFSEFGPMRQAGLEVYQDGNPYVMHHKVFVLDDRVTAFGSFNFSDNAATSNDENLVFVDHPAFARAFMEEVERVVAVAKSPLKERVQTRDRQRPS